VERSLLDVPRRGRRRDREIQRFQSACASDAARFCPDVPAGGGKIFACLKLYEEAVSTACRDAMRP
jgi:hypothetical protein